MESGDKFSIKSISGGGYGDPYDRPKQKVYEDYLDDFLTEEAAREDYGVVIEDGEVDEEATRRLRSS